MKNITSLLGLGLLIFMAAPTTATAQEYHLYVAAESEDEVYMVSYDADSQEGRIADTIPVGQWPTENEGPHGINVGLDGEYWYVTIAHGNPYGWLYKYTTGTNEFVEKTELGMFPATLEISPASGLLYVVNFNLHGDMEPSTVSVVDPEAMKVVSEIPTGIMPHGSRITTDGRYQYHVSMMTDELIQINTVSMQVSKRFPLVKKEGSGKTANHEGMHGDGSSHAKSVCKPTWADPHPDTASPLVYVACNGSDKIMEINTNTWSVTRVFETGKAPYNLEVTPNGDLLVATYKGEGTTAIWDLDNGTQKALITNSRKVSHGVTISSDSKLAFISVEGIGGEPGSVDIVDLSSLERTDVVEVGKQAGGIIFWKKTEAGVSR